MELKYKVIILLLSISLISSLPAKTSEPPFLNYLNDGWVNEQMESLSLDEKVAQLMMITAYPSQTEKSRVEIINQIKKYKPGGVLVMQGSPVKSAKWINDFQEVANVPLLVAIDGEWGLSMRMDSTIHYPYAQALGAVQDSTYLYQMGRDIGNQMHLTGIHINFAPVADVSTNPDNPVINFRSFGEDKLNVAKKTWHISEGMQDAGVIPVAKHFPGHGDTETDSHLTLPVVPHSKKRIDEIESFPFRFLAEKGISGIMSAHLNVEALDNSGVPSSLSEKIINGYLKNEIGFKGFIVTDAMNMKGVRTQTGNPEVQALKAGNDMLEFVPNLEAAIESVKQAIDYGRLTTTEIEEKCRKILALKRWVNLNLYTPAETDNLTPRLNSAYYEVTNRKLIKGSFTVLQNNNILPVQHLDSFKIASVMIGGSEQSRFPEMLKKYAQTDHFYVSKNSSEREWANLRKKLNNYNLVITGVAGVNVYPSRAYGTTEIQRKAVSDLVQENNTVVVFFGNAYAIKHFKNLHHADGLIVAYQNTPLTQELAAQLVFGGIEANGKLPVSIDWRFNAGDGMLIKKNESLSYTIPEELEINSKQLYHDIDSIANYGLEEEAYPGCQVLIAKNGTVFFHKTYGYHTYRKSQKVRKDDIYDWASLTKVTGPLPPLMQLTDKGQFNLNAPFSRYWPDFKGTDKENIKVRKVLAHQAQLPAWISYWHMALDNEGKLSDEVFKHHPTDKFSVRISENLFMNHDYRKTMFDTIRHSELLSRNRYVYSGLSFYLYPDIIANITGKDYEEYLNSQFLNPLGAYTVTYNPYKHFPLKRIIPTENDDFFRMEKLHGFVHDEGAAMMGGVSGNAGLFGSTNDLAKIFQMYLQKGYYGGERYISKKTMNEFTRIQYPDNDNRRGLGFDKPYIDNHENDLEDAYPAVDCSPNSFGHSGYTGTFAWADPENGLLFIFMSNRVHPTRNNTKLYELNIRTAMHQAIYDNL